MGRKRKLEKRKNLRCKGGRTEKRKRGIKRKLNVEMDGELENTNGGGEQEERKLLEREQCERGE